MPGISPKCGYDYGIYSEQECTHPPMTDPETGEVMDYCIFHAPMEKKAGREEEFWEAFEKYFKRTKEVFDAAPADKKDDVVFDCEGFVIPDTGERFRNRIFLFDMFFCKATFQRRVDFRGVTFEGDADFWAATFEGPANFEKAKFKIKACFEIATFKDYTDFGSALFGGKAYFAKANFTGKINFLWATFERGADFLGARFQSSVDFGSVNFDDSADFEEARFEGNASFRGAIFKGYQYFTAATFEVEVKFRVAKFERYSYFIETNFEGEADFRQAKFEAGADFEGATLKCGGCFELARLSEVSFIGVDIRGVVFSAAVLGESAQRAEYDGDKIETLRPIGSADFAHADYNAHNRFFGLLVYSIYYRIIRVVKRVGELFSKEVALPRYRPQRFYRTKFYGVDTSAVDWSKNPGLFRDIRYQQFLKQFWDRGPGYKFLYFIWWLTSRCGESFKRWLAWSAALILGFAWVYANVPGENGGALVTERQEISWKCPAYNYTLTLDNDAPAEPRFGTALYFSVVTFTTLGFGDVTQTCDLGKLIVGAEVVLGYVMLGGLIALFANKLVRRE